MYLYYREETIFSVFFYLKKIIKHKNIIYDKIKGLLLTSSMYKNNLSKYNQKTEKFSADKVKTLKRAINKIKLTVYYIYDNQIIKTEIDNTRKDFNIPNNFFEDCKTTIASNNIKVLLAETIQEWSKNKEKNQITELDTQIFNKNNFDKYGSVNSFV